MSLSTGVDILNGYLEGGRFLSMLKAKYAGIPDDAAKFKEGARRGRAAMARIGCAKDEDEAKVGYKLLLMEYVRAPNPPCRISLMTFPL